MSGSPDVVIVGGGGIGSAIAYFLTRESGATSVRVYERDPSYARAATTLAAGGIRQMFSTPENILMSQYGFEFLTNSADDLAVDELRPDFGLQPCPYLRLLTEVSRDLAHTQFELQRSLGAQPRWLERAELGAMFPWLTTDDVGCAILGGAGEGVFDPHSLLQALRRKAVAQGADFVKAEVVGFERDRTHAITAVLLNDGTRCSCGRVVDAAGPAAGAVAALAGLELPVVAMKALTFAFRAEAPVTGCPIVLDHVSGLNFKPEGQLFLAGWSGGNEPAALDDFEMDQSLFESAVWPALAHRVPAFEAVRLVRGWTGHFELNPFDRNPILGPHPDCPNFLFAAGFSGHGAQHIPAAGRAIAELLLWGEYRTLDLTRLGYDRWSRQSPLVEQI